MTTHSKSTSEVNQVEYKDQLHCGVCGQLNDSVLNFIQHKITHVDRGAGRGCEICQLAFSRQTALYEHYRRKHSIIFDTKLDQDDTTGARLKSQVKEKVKGVKERKKSAKGGNSLETGITLSENNIQQIPTALSLPNGLMYDVKLKSNSYATSVWTDTNGSIDGLSDSTVLPGPSSLTETVVLTGLKGSSGNEPQTVSVVTTGSDLYDCTVISSSSELLGSSTLTCSTALNFPSISHGSLVLSNATKINGDSSLANIYQPVNSHNTVVFEQGDNTCVETGRHNSNSNASSGTKYFILKSFGKSDSHYVTETCKSIGTKELDSSAKSDPDTAVMENETLIAKTLDVSSANEIYTTQRDSAETASLANYTVAALGNSGVKKDDNFVADENKQCESHISEKMSKETNDNSCKSINQISQSTITCTQSFKKRGKLAPVLGKIPQELDMPDFYFLNSVTKSGKSVKNTHAGKDQFKCLFCAFVVKWRASMCRHMREDHDDLLRSGAASMTPLQSNTEDGKLLKMTEYIAMEMAERPSKRIRGVESQDLLGDYPCEQCGKVFSRLRYLRLHVQNHKRKSDLLCALCSKTFKTQNNLIQHLKTHEEREPYKCPECDFESAVNIAIHKHRQIHNANSLICDICGQAYSDKSTLKKHKQVHDPSRPFGCSIPGCTWRFRTKVMRDAHVQGHGSKRTFKCEVCGYAFRQKHHLQRHEKVVHNIVQEPKPLYTTYYNNTDTEFNENQFEDISNDVQSGMEVTQGVNLIINEGNMSNVVTADHFDLESALQNGQLVIATDDRSINYEMSDIGSNVVYQTLLPEGETQHFESQTICIPQSETSQMAYEEVETVQSEVEIEQS